MTITATQARLMRLALDTPRIAETFANLDRKRHAGRFEAGQAAGYLANNVRDAMRTSPERHALTRADRDATAAALVHFYLAQCGERV